MLTALKADRLASLRVEVAVVAFGGKVRAIDVRGDPPQEGKQVVVFNPLGLALRKPTREVPFNAQQAFVTVDKLEPPVLDADGGTPMGEAVQRSLGLLRERKEIYKQNGLDYFRPWMFVISDGKPTDKGWEAAGGPDQAGGAAQGRHFLWRRRRKRGHACSIPFSDVRQPLKLRGLAFDELFMWLSKSLSAIAHSRPGEQTPLPPVGWGSVDTSS